MPELPVYDIFLREGGFLKARMGPRVGGAVNCNWLQSEENLMDALHGVWLHTLHSGAQFPTDLHNTLPDEMKYEETEMGMRFLMSRKLSTGKWWDVIWEMIMPLNIHLTYTDEPRHEKVRSLAYCVPVDDTHQLGASIRWFAEDEPQTKTGREKLAPGGVSERTYEYTQRYPDDKEAQEGQGEIAVHGLEHLASSDKGVIMFRKILRDAIHDMRGKRSQRNHSGSAEGTLRRHDGRKYPQGRMRDVDAKSSKTDHRPDNRSISLLCDEGASIRRNGPA